MKENNQLYKSIFLILILVFGVATLYAIKTDEAPRFILFLGRFHPLLLHLPIGALVVTFFIDILSRFQKNYPEITVRNLFGFIAVFSIITCFLGYFLSLEDGYNKDTLDLHFYTGIGTAIVSCFLFLMSLKPDFKSNKLFLPLFIIALVCISVAGHYGSVLTHGDNFITEYASAPEKEKTIEIVDSLRLYEDVVAKILDAKCIQCHNTTKQKGELALLSKAHILNGGVSGVSAIAGNASESLLYSRLLLPITDEKHMPPEGKEQLTKDEIWLVEHWINEGLDFENYVANTSENIELRKKLEKYLVFDTIEIPKASKDDIEEVKLAGFRIIELVPGEADLNVKLLKAKPTEDIIDKLSVLNEQIVELDLSNMAVTDAMTSVFKKFKNLKSLRLNGTKISDVSLKYIKDLKNLETLNIYNTNVSNQGLSELLKTIKPKTIYAWKTKVDKETAIQLEKEYDVDIQNTIVDGFIKKSQLEKPVVSPNKTLFTDTIHINIRSRIKGVDIRYTLNGKIPDSTSKIYNGEIILEASKILKIASFKKGWLPSEILERELTKVDNRVEKFVMKTKPDERYPDSNKLFDLKEGSLDFKDGQWVGYFGTSLNTTIDLGAIKTINNISFNCLEDVGSWILYPTDFIVYASNYKNKDFKKIGELDIKRQGQGGEPELKKVTLKLPETKTRYLKLRIKNHEKLPAWHPSAGNPSWLFVDEIYLW
ncbi:c-type cytochrome domain-containing protein [uncultured Lacinutrix sp.]|uniref:c-type cytochrome domain-containing protein n=1 Tax=uncultured Lacinutrix sp. TaxID=574032 RepID=UPI00261DE865|nr:c-type cytochrome domain-containing protein [uncultured Lacinutrix sp.]